MLAVSALTFSLFNRTLVKDVSFSARVGDIIGFIGLNGAGKSTCMRMMAGVLEPSSGSVSHCGYDIIKERKLAQSNIGFLPEGAPLYGEMTPKSYLQFVCEARNLPKEKHRELIIDIAEKANLESVFHQRIETLSKGFKRRVALAGAIVHQPKILLLDEPTDGLDPKQRRATYEVLKSISPESIIIISTHMLDELSEICNRAIIIDNGEILRDFSPQELSKLGENGTLESGFHKLIAKQNSKEVKP